ncbi:phosphodiester glycosidase family protein [Longitalea luteola]|uniref:phosphodiester glycosidase family protein n=1 Tax=Longitalea luteola TaxID=2812563 RepID=UPI001A96A26E|nr:phosphodiester glycosidase family protein [Longitalea luteola]
MKWIKANNEFDSLPASIRIFKTSDSLNGRPFRAWCAEVKLKDKQLDFTAQTGEGNSYTPSEFYNREGKPYIVVNGGYFSPQTRQNLNLIMREGKIVAYNVPALKSLLSDSFYYATRSAFGISKNRQADVAWVFTDTAKRWPYGFQTHPIIAKGSNPDPSFTDLHTIEQWNWWKMHTAIGGGPVLVQEGAVFITNKEEQLYAFERNDRHPRTAIGYTRNHRLIILVIQGRSPGIAEGATLDEEARILVDLGCVEAINLDGGGSSCMLINGKETIVPSDETQRPVASVFMVLRGRKSETGNRRSEVRGLKSEVRSRR